MVGKKCATCKFYPGDKMVCKKGGMKVDQYDWCYAWRKSTPLTIMDRQAVAEHVKELEEELEKYKKAWAMVPNLIEKHFCSLEIKPNIKPKHGTCCTCQTCGYLYDECNCLAREVVCDLNKIARECGLEVE